ncbi:hypothetical protein [Aquihabitans sp. McL0605]|uniref:hypothetical protein n=1 Tax=Aquihabitans sp. McL0605 TaxID=3415671 RepID=UPI003CF2E856
MIDRSQVQWLVLRPNNRRGCTSTSTGSAPRALAEFLGVVRPWVAYADATGRTDRVNVAITGDGIRLLDTDARSRAAMPAAFMDGMRAAVARLGDRGPSAPAHWEAPFRPDDPDVHVAVLTLRWDPEPPLDAAWTELRDRFADERLPESWTGVARPENREAFGFRDMISDPVIEGSGRRVTPGNGVWEAWSKRWRAVRAGEAVLGHLDESGAVGGHPDAALLERDGSYLVLRKLGQDKALFVAECQRIADASGHGAVPAMTWQEVAEQIVGRRFDGQALGQEGSGEPENDFCYRDGSVNGKATPASSHIRRANPTTTSRRPRR